MGIRTQALGALAQSTNQNQNTNQAEKREPAQFYLNVGFERDDDQFPFVDLSKGGIPLDRLPEHDIRGDLDTPWKIFAATQDALKAKFMAAAEALSPGETKIVVRDEASGICLQVRRVGNKEEMPTNTVEISGISFL